MIRLNEYAKLTCTNTDCKLSICEKCCSENPGDYLTCHLCESYTACPDCSKDNIITPRSYWPFTDWSDKIVCLICADENNIESSNNEYEIATYNEDIHMDEHDINEDNDNDSENEENY